MRKKDRKAYFPNRGIGSRAFPEKEFHAVLKKLLILFIFCLLHFFKELREIARALFELLCAEAVELGARVLDDRRGDEKEHFSIAICQVRRAKQLADPRDLTEKGKT